MKEDSDISIPGMADGATRYAEVTLTLLLCIKRSPQIFGKHLELENAHFSANCDARTDTCRPYSAI